MTDVTTRSAAAPTSSARISPPAEVRFAIDDLYATYLWALDTQDIEVYLGTFWPEAAFIETQLDGEVLSWEGVDSIREFTASHFGGYNGHQHRESNRVYLDGGAPDRVRLRSYWSTTHREADSGEVSLSSTGHSFDTIERRGDEWRFVRRWVERWPGDAEHPLRSATHPASDRHPDPAGPAHHGGSH